MKPIQPIVILIVSLTTICICAAQKSAETVYFATALNDQRISFFSLESNGNPQAVGTLPQNFGIANLSNGEWLIPDTENFAVSPSGDWIAFAAHRGDENVLFIYDLSSGTLQQKSVPYLFKPFWSPDSDAILLQASPVAYVYEIVSNQLVEITNAPDEVGGNFQWLPDGKTIIYTGLNAASTPAHVEVYTVKRDGSGRQRLTDLQTDVPSDVNPRPCQLTWSPADRRIYYVVGCSGFKDNPRDYLFSVKLAGENQLELALPTAFNENTFVTAIRNITPTSFGTLVTYQADLANGDHHWRIVSLTPIATTILFDYAFENSRELYTATLSPDRQQIALVGLTDENVYGSIHLLVGSLADQKKIAEIDGSSGYICNTRWIDNHFLAYETTDIPCFGNESKPVELWLLDTQINKTTQLSTDLGRAWLLRTS